MAAPTLLAAVCLAQPTTAPDSRQAARQATAERLAAAKRAAPKPTFSDVAYGMDPKQKLDFWKADSPRPTPLVFYIHGGGWMHGDKDMIHHPTQVGAPTRDFLAAGISVVSIDYRTLVDARAAEVKPPIAWPLHDAARALQFVRSKAAEWNIDKARIGATGSSAGATSSLWLAFHADMADPNSADPVARESTRLACAGVDRPQTTLDPKLMKEWIPNSEYGGNAFGFFPERGNRDRASAFGAFLAGRDEILPWINEYSCYELADASAPPIYMFYWVPPAMGQEQKDPTHSANFGVKMQEKLRRLGVECHLMYPKASGVPYRTTAEFLIAKLTASAAAPVSMRQD